MSFLTPSLLHASTSTLPSLLLPLTIRHATTLSRTPPSPPTSTQPRIHTPRKQFLFSYYTHLLHSNEVVLIFQPNNLTTKEVNNLRRGLPKVKVPVVKGEGSGEEEGRRAVFTVTRTGLLAATFRKLGASSPSTSTSTTSTSTPSSSSSYGPTQQQPYLATQTLHPILSGPTAILTIPSLSPQYLKSLFQAINTSFSYRPPASSLTNPLSSSTTSPLISPLSPRLLLLGGIISNQALSTPEIIHTSTLPELDALRSELVGVLSMAGGAGLVGVLERARGGQLVGTLKGLEEGLRGGSAGEGGVEELKV